MKTKLLLFLIVGATLVAAPSVNAPTTPSSIASVFDSESTFAQLDAQLFASYPEANAYFRGRADAFAEAAAYVRSQQPQPAAPVAQRFR